MKTLRSNVVVDGIVYAEGIRWNEGKVWFSDMLDRTVYAYDVLARRAEVVVRTEDLPSGLGFLPDGRLLIVAMRERRLLRLDADGLKVAADLESLCEMLNDMVVDAQGRAYVDCHFSRDAPGGGIILVEPNGDARIVVHDMAAPNGLAITPDGRRLIANDLMANRLVAFDIAPDGGLANQRVFADLGDRSPDGLCLDTEGGAWVGLPFQAKFQRIAPGGAVTHEVPCGDKWGVAPVLGGADRRTLFLCTAQVSLEDMPGLLQSPTDARAKCRGWIEAVEGIEVPGAGRP
jgi:sugar lactone lactonase YvrE